jgi:hypothetical protein
MKKTALILGLAIFGIALVAAVAKMPENDSAAVVKSETLRGSLFSVDVDHKLIVVATSDRVMFDFIVTPATTIKLGDHKVKLDGLAAQIGKPTEVDYRALRTGNRALKIEIQ